jgi:hypothetical protein
MNSFAYIHAFKLEASMPKVILSHAPNPSPDSQEKGPALYMFLSKVDQQNCKQSLDFIDFSCLRQDRQ